MIGKERSLTTGELSYKTNPTLFGPQQEGSCRWSSGPRFCCWSLVPRSLGCYQALDEPDLWPTPSPVRRKAPGGEPTNWRYPQKPQGAHGLFGVSRTFRMAFGCRGAVLLFRRTLQRMAD